MRISRSRAPRGSAILWVLLLCGFLAVVCLTFLGTATASKTQARVGKDETTSDDLLASATSEVLAKLGEGFAVESGPAGGREGHVAAMPGLLEVRRFDDPLNRGSKTGSNAFEGTDDDPSPFLQPFASEYDRKAANPRWIPMFSWKSFAPRLKHLSVSQDSPRDRNPDYNPYEAFNINTAENPFTPGTTWISAVAEDSQAMVRREISGKRARQGSEDDFTVASGATSAERPVWVQWIPVLKDPMKPASASNPMIGRYAYWVDLENTKLRADRPFVSARDIPQFARLVGESGAVDGGSEHFDQDGGNSSRELLAKMESLLPSGSASMRNGNPGPGFSAAAAKDSRDAWLDSDAIKGVIDWSFFESPRRSSADVDLTVGKELATTLAAASTRERPAHPWFVNFEKEMEGDEEAMHQARQVAASMTFHGTEENLDPLGFERIDLQEFQKGATGNRSTPVSIAAIKSSKLWSRLGDAGYQRAYHPGTPKKSFFDSLAPFSNNGQSAALQMLVNIAEAAQPDSVPPLIDTATGIVGARSMPYVAEISTRARSAFWLLPKADRENPAVLLAKTGSGAFAYTYDKKRLQHYATHAVVDLCVGLVNPNPYETEPFEGEIVFDVTWGTKPAGAVVESGPFRATLSGHFTANPQAGKDAKDLQPLGHTVNIRLGTFPVAALNDDKFRTCLKIKGWKIYRNGQLWHQVPVRHPGSSGVLDWWRMAQNLNYNTGSPDKSGLSSWSDPGSLGAYKEGATPRSVGWFCRETLDAILPDSLGVEDWTSSDDATPATANKVATWFERTPMTSVMERVVCIDPVLGHRTLNPGILGVFGTGHFYGAKGHPWRRKRVIDPQPVVYIGETEQGRINLSGRAWGVQSGESSSASVVVEKENSTKLVPTSVQWPVPEAELRVLANFSGQYLTHRLSFPNKVIEKDAEDPDPWDEVKIEPSNTLTAIYRIPSVEGPASPGKLSGSPVSTTVIIDSATKVENVDLEVAKGSDMAKELVKIGKGPRSFFCSAPAKRYFSSVGEIGFCHSGFPGMPILVGPEEGRTPNQLNCPLNGPPMRMLLDLFQVASTGNQAWNVNTTIAQDEYMSLREGGDDGVELKKEIDPSSMTARAVWLPNARGFSRRETGSDAYRGKEAKNLADKNPGQLLDRRSGPYAAFSRPWDMWTGIVGGDFSPGRAGESLRWGVGNSLSSYFGPGYFSWQPGNGAGADPWIDFGSDMPGAGRLLTFGTDGRKDDKNENEGKLKGRFAADQNLKSVAGGSGFILPAHFATRFSLLPVRHFRSDLAIDFHQESQDSEWLRLKTALNPGIGAAFSISDAAADKDIAEKLDGASFPGGHHATGVFYHAPMALLANQAGTSANAFTAYIVVQTIKDRGKKRDGVENSGPGHSDPDDVVLAQRWVRSLILKETNSAGKPVFRIAFSDQGNL